MRIEVEKQKRKKIEREQIEDRNSIDLDKIEQKWNRNAIEVE